MLQKLQTLSLTARPLTLKLPSHRTFSRGDECLVGQIQVFGLACLSKKGGRGWANELLYKKRKHVDISHDMRNKLDETQEHRLV